MRTLRILAAAAIAIGLVLAPLPATAADTPDFTPSGSKWRAYMINILGSVLGGALPPGFKAEQIANQFQYNHSWDQFAAQHGYSANSRNVNGDLMPIPKPGQGTYDDYVIAEYEKQMQKGGKGNKPFAAPATKPLGFAKTVGGALAVFTAFEVGNYLGAAGTNLAGGWFGFDPQGAVCGGTTDGTLLSGALRYLSGQDCSMFDLSAEYTANGDAGIVAGPLIYGSYKFEYLGTFTPAGWPYGVACAKITGTVPTGMNLYGKDQAGVTRSFGPGAAGQSSDSQSCPAGRTHWYGVWKTGAASTYITAVPVWIANANTPDTKVAETSMTQADPDRQMDCKVTNTDGTSQTSTGPVYKESSGAVSPPACPPTPAGKTPAKIEVNDRQLGGGPTTEVTEQPVTPEYQEWAEDYPECAGGACKLDLKKKTTPRVSCFDLEQGCLGWFEDPAKTDNYVCTYGAHDVDLAECNVYSGLFQPQRVEIGSAYSDPTTGAWSGGQTSPKSGTKAMQSTVQNPELQRSCDFSGLGFDPVGWVLKPIQCAFEWAFIPRPSVAELSFAQVADVWADKPPGAIAAAVDSMNLTGSATGCSITTTYKGTTTPIVDACGGFMSALATFTRFATLALMAFAVFAQVRRQIAGMVNYNVGQD